MIQLSEEAMKQIQGGRFSWKRFRRVFRTIGKILGTIATIYNIYKSL